MHNTPWMNLNYTKEVRNKCLHDSIYKKLLEKANIQGQKAYQWQSEACQETVNECKQA